MGQYAYSNDWLDGLGAGVNTEVIGESSRLRTDYEVGDYVFITKFGVIGEVILVTKWRAPESHTGPFVERTILDVRYKDHRSNASCVRGFQVDQIRRLTWDESEAYRKSIAQENYNDIVRDAAPIGPRRENETHPLQLMANSSIEDFEEGDSVYVLNTGSCGHVFRINYDAIGGTLIQVLHDDRKYYSYRPSELSKEPKPLRCGRCKGPFHPATGHMFTANDVACGPCAGRFWAWMIYAKQGWHYSKKKHKLVRHIKKPKGNMGFRGFVSF